MQRMLVAVSTVAAFVLFAPPSAVEAQSNTKPVIAPPSRTINLTAEQSFIIKEIVLKDLHVPKAQDGAPDSIGDIAPFSGGDAHASDACLLALAQQEAMSALRAQLPEITGMRRNLAPLCGV
jgi:hypothetical protein